jgi:hypothetical protein
VGVVFTLAFFPTFWDQNTSDKIMKKQHPVLAFSHPLLTFSHPLFTFTELIWWFSTTRTIITSFTVL